MVWKNISRYCARKDSCARGSYGGGEVRAAVGVVQHSLEVFLPPLLEQNCQSFLQSAKFTSDLPHTTHHQPNPTRSKRTGQNANTLCKHIFSPWENTEKLEAYRNPRIHFVWIFCKAPHLKDTSIFTIT